ncbi:MAG: queuosine precursor transporter [Clostridia bacterium]|nr:queuosine precursor transporter [Clostridia bacterium]
MGNFCISVIYLILTFLLTLLCFKRYGKYGIYIWMCVSVLICNIQTIKISEIFGMTISLGNISYGAIFLSTDILSEKYGRDSTKTAINLSFFTMIIFTILMQIFLQYQPNSVDVSQKSLETIFNYMPRITIGSLTAYYCSQMCDAKVYSFLKKKYNKVWISNNGSTFISQILDTLIFVTISFFGTMSNRDLFFLILTMICCKFIIAILDTPFMLLVTKMKNKELD